MKDDNFIENRGRPILVGAVILAIVTVVATSFLLFWRLVPGWLGDALGAVAGIISTPFFMEASFICLGVIIVVGINAWRRHKEGDEFVLLEVNEPAGSTDSASE